MAELTKEQIAELRKRAEAAHPAWKGATDAQLVASIESIDAQAPPKASGSSSK